MSITFLTCTIHLKTTTFSLTSQCKTFRPKTLMSKPYSKSSPILSCSLKIDRRTALIGLGSLYGAATASPRTGNAAPIAPPDLSKCGTADLPTDAVLTKCCTPNSSKIIDFVLPDPSTPLRLRPPAHSVDKAYVEKLKKAIELMKALPSDDPRNFTQQAIVHCAYCDGAYDQLGFPNLEFQVHHSWLFLPWHRWYLYFFERILGQLMDDDELAIPFWNWDAPEGMRMPEMYTDPSSPLFDPLRDAKHQPPMVVDLDYKGDDDFLSEEQQIDHKLRVMYRQIISNASIPSLFFGEPYRSGDIPAPGSGSLERVPHGTVHIWTGDRKQKNRENMGNLYSASRDPIFYAHHSNIDRLWTVWKSLDGKHKDLSDLDWLEASFVFYDENAELVKVRVRDCIDTNKLRYDYQQVDIPWLQTKPKVTPSLKTNKAYRSESLSLKFPLELSSVVSVMINRPRGLLRMKEGEEEVLVIDGIEFPSDVYVKFDVYVNVLEHWRVGAGGREMAGSFASVPHKKGMELMKTMLKLGLNELLKDLGIEDGESVLVTLVMRTDSVVKVGSVRIELMV